MSKENNKMQVDIDTLKKQNVNDLLSIKEIYSKLEELGEKITKIKYIDNTLVKKIKKEYENLNKIILDENIQVQLDNKIDEFNLKLTHDIETINSQLDNKVNKIDIETINSQLDTIANKGTTVEVLERVTKEEIDRQIEDGTIAAMTIEDGTISSLKLDKNIKETLNLINKPTVVEPLIDSFDNKTTPISVDKFVVIDVPISSNNEIIIKCKCVSAGTKKFYFGKRIVANDDNDMGLKIDRIEEFEVKKGENIISTGIKYSEEIYIGTSFINLYYSQPNGIRYFESSTSVSSLVVGSQPYCKVNSSKNELAIEFYVNDGVYVNGLETRVIAIEDKVNKKELNYPKKYNTPKYIISENIDNSFFENYYFLGRWCKKRENNTDYMYTINLGSEIHCRIKNTTSATIKFRADTKATKSTIAYSVDGGNLIRVQLNNNIITINNLTTDEHYLRIIFAGNTNDDLVWTGMDGLFFESVIVDEGGIITPVKPKQRVGLFFGDSISAGCWVLGTKPSVDYAAEQNYIFKACEKLNVSNIRVGFSGQGLLRGGRGGVPVFYNIIDNMNKYRQTFTPTYDYEVDFICVNYGTNDSSFDSTTFKTEYDRCIKKLQLKYSGIPIFVLRPFNGSHENVIEEICISNSNTIYVDTTNWNITYTDGVHPDLNGSINASEQLAEFLLNYFGSDYFEL